MPRVHRPGGIVPRVPYPHSKLFRMHERPGASMRLVRSHDVMHGCPDGLPNLDRLVLDPRYLHFGVHHHDASVYRDRGAWMDQLVWLG
jgi:hypothetical protein